MAAAEEVLYFICTKGDGAMGLTARTGMGRICLGFGFRGSPLLYLSRALQECRERSQSLPVRRETASPGMCRSCSSLPWDALAGPRNPIPGNSLVWQQGK